MIDNFGGFGIHVRDGIAILIAGNFIGTDVHGTTAAPNNLAGILIEQLNGSATDNQVGGTTATDRNVISGNNEEAIVIQGLGATHNLVEGNFIGTDVSGKHALGNQHEGAVHIIEAPHNFIGGKTISSGNLIAYNADVGIRICCSANASHNAILGNAIFSNGGLGIDLGFDGNVTNNDTGDGDTGPNGYQNFPVLTSADSNSLVIKGTLNSAIKASYTLQFYASATCDASLYGEGRKVLGALSVNTDGSGNISFTFKSPRPFKSEHRYHRNCNRQIRKYFRIQQVRDCELTGV